MKTLGTRLKYWREAEKLTVYDLASLTTISEDELNLIETDCTLPSRDNLNKLRIFTDIDFHWFLLGTTEPIATDLVCD